MGALIRDSLGYLVGRVANGVLAIAALSIFTRLLGREGYGTYALWLATVSVCSTVGFQWLAVSLNRLLAAHQDRPSALVRATIALYWRTAACVVVLGIAASPFLPRSRVALYAAILVVAGTIGMGWQNILVQLANAQQRPVAYGMLTFTRAAVGLVLAVLLVLAGLGGLGALAAIPLSCLAIAFVGKSVLRLPRDREQSTAVAPLADLWRYGLPLSLTYVAVPVIDLSDRFLLSWYKGPGAVAGYAASYDLVQQVIGASMNVFFLAGFPRAVAAWESGDRAASIAAIQWVGRLIIFFGGLAIVLFVWLAPMICRILFGAGVSAEATQVMPVIAVAIGLAAYRSFFLDAILQLQRKTRGQMVIMVIMAAVNIGANLLLIPTFGALGAAYGTVLAVACGVCLTVVLGRQLITQTRSVSDLAVGVVITGAAALSCHALHGDYARISISTVLSSLTVVAYCVIFLAIYRPKIHISFLKAPR